MMNALRTGAWMVLAGAAAAGLGGCAAFSWFVAQFAPPQEVKAEFKLPKDKKVLVFVDDMLHEVNYAPIKGDLTEKLNSQLAEHKIAANTIPYEQVQDLAARGDFNRLAVKEVGEKLGADVVIYVDIERFSLKENEASPLWRGELAGSVRVVDVKVGRLWPTDREKYPVPAVETPPTENASKTYGAELSRLLAEKLADRIAKLFYDHKVPVQSFDQEK